MRAIVLLSNGIDSPVAAHLMKQKGLELIFLNLSMGKTNVDELKHTVSPSSPLIKVDFLRVIRNISKKANSKYTCLLCKRAMLREAEKVAEENGADCIVTGENLGQVASQTLDNMAVIESAVDLPVLRPLLCFDKNEIIEIARKIGTYEMSIKKNGKCSFVPTNPATKAKLKIIECEETQLSK